MLTFRSRAGIRRTPDEERPINSGEDAPYRPTTSTMVQIFRFNPLTPGGFPKACRQRSRLEGEPAKPQLCREHPEHGVRGTLCSSPLGAALEDTKASLEHPDRPPWVPSLCRGIHAFTSRPKPSFFPASPSPPRYSFGLLLI